MTTDPAAISECRTLETSIRRAEQDVYEYLADPLNLPCWSAFITAVHPDGTAWRVETTQGEVRMEFAPRNAFGIVDHHVTLPDGGHVYIPMRVVADTGGGSHVLFTVFRQLEMSDEQYAADIAMVSADLAQLKTLLETRARV